MLDTYAIYRALAIAAGTLDAVHVPDLSNTAPAEPIAPNPRWFDPDRIVSLDPWGHLVVTAFADRLAEGLDIRPTIAVTKARRISRCPSCSNRSPQVACAPTPQFCSPMAVFA